MSAQPDELISFFAVVDGEQGREMRRIPIAQDLQEQLSRLFLQQEKDLVGDRERVEFDPDDALDDSEVFEIKNFVLPPQLQNLEKKGDALPVLTTEEVASGVVEALVGVTQQNVAGKKPRILLQAFSISQVLKPERTFFLSGDVYRRMTAPGLTVGVRLTAVYEDGALLFAKEQAARRVVDLNSVFREATMKDIQEFVGSDHFSVSDIPKLSLALDNWGRRRIGSLLSKGLLSTLDKPKLLKVAKKWGITLRANGKGTKLKIELPQTRKELKHFLKLLGEDFFEGELTSEPYVAGSKRGFKK